jgi:hypothetical protein
MQLPIQVNLPTLIPTKASPLSWESHTSIANLKLKQKETCKWVCDAFDLTQLSLEGQGGNKITVNARWRHPVQRIMKITVDNVGVVIRDDQGYVREGFRL